MIVDVEELLAGLIVATAALISNAAHVECSMRCHDVAGTVSGQELGLRLQLHHIFFVRAESI